MTAAGLTARLLGHGRAFALAMLGLLFLLAGLYTLLGVGMPMSALEMTRGPAMAAAQGGWSAAQALLVFLMWWVMMIAMMLPAVAPTVLLHAALLSRGAQADRAPALTAAFLGGYLAAWAGFSAAATAAHRALEAGGAVTAGGMALTAGVPGALLLIAAGVYQFTPLKGACLTQCRAPAAFLARHWRPGAAGSLRMGLAHGVFCLGCCWVLMALLFVGGVMNLYWIVGLAAFVALEKLTPLGARAGRVGGLVLIGWGVLVLSGGG
ncbi:DUF2182 domain-containing protein [Rhodobacteraceae bacterium 2CG4]|uniref:DUF2182 domain-containing protein n=1 Tax=Halovulum marinum TaxID=2662447 RepID=A0A6L5Z4L2_9RHOB|nr:DUF2182 domain-containing protein [Halovulum marinum]MSU91496.1 DUF2182 domain-containing protein [Halovulum marinum]